MHLRVFPFSLETGKMLPPYLSQYSSFLQVVAMKFSIQLALAFSLLIVPLIANADVLLDDFETGTHSQFTTGLDGNFYDTDIPLPGAAGPLRLIQHA